MIIQPPFGRICFIVFQASKKQIQEKNGVDGFIFITPWPFEQKHRSSLTEQTTPVALALSDTIAIVSWRKAVVKGRVWQWVGWPYTRWIPLDIMLSHIYSQTIQPKVQFFFSHLFFVFYTHWHLFLCDPNKISRKHQHCWKTMTPVRPWDPVRGVQRVLRRFRFGSDRTWRSHYLGWQRCTWSLDAFQGDDLARGTPVHPRNLRYPSLPNTLWVGVWTPKHLRFEDL